MIFDGIIIGGGASGLACGIEAVRRGKHCLILEQKEKPGKKLYATGNGKCNFANRRVESSLFHSVEAGDDASESECELSKLLTDSLCQQAEDFFRNMGIPAAERQGYLYPRSEQAASLVHAMEQVFQEERGQIICNERVEEIRWNSSGRSVQVLTKAHQYEGRTVVLATGGMASPALGSDGSGYALASSIGHTITPCVPALCGLKCRERGWNRLQGVRAKGQVTIWQEQCAMAVDSGEIQFTQYGLSGIVIFNLSRYAALGLAEYHPVRLTLDFLPDYSEKTMLNTLQALQKDCGYRGIRDILSGFLPEKLAGFLIDRAGIPDEPACSSLSRQQLQAVIRICKELSVRITDTNSFEQAQVTAGGVPLNEIHLSTMESKLQPGCYLTGELLDIDAVCGGYNLMWAWETGRRAGRSL